MAAKVDQHCNILHARFTSQLDTLVPFLALAHREIFDVLSRQYSFWYSDNRRETLPDSLESYTHQVAHAAFLLGYSYAEAFVTDLMFHVYSIRRDLLPDKRQLTYKDVISQADFEALIRHIINCTLGDMNSLEKKLLHLEERFGLSVPQPPLMIDAHVARNALVHNAGRVNRHQGSSTRWKEGSDVRLSTSEVHQFGLMAREYTLEMCRCAAALCRSR